jgi:hypothetical protein
MAPTIADNIIDDVRNKVIPHITTLETQSRDSLDFHTLSVSTLRKIIIAAWEAGWELGWDAKKESDEWNKAS